MKNKRITKAVSLALLLALLIGVLPLSGLVGTASAETPETVSSETQDVPEDLLLEETTEAETTQETEATSVPEDAEAPIPEFSEEPPGIEPGTGFAALPAAGEIQASSVTMRVPFIIYGSSGSTLSVSFQYPNDASHTTYSTTITGMKIHYLNGSVAYCLEPQAASTAGEIYSEIAGGAELNVWTEFLSKDQRHATALALTYGAPNTLNSTNDLTRHGYEIATQVIIWELITGDRNAVKPYTRTSARWYNFFQPLMNSNDSTGVLNAAFQEAYSSITSAMAQHGNIPSFTSQFITSAPTHTMNYDASTGNYTITLTDSNNAINNDFPYTNGNGLTFSKSGNQLTITATPAALQNAPVMVTSTGSDPDVDNVVPVVWGTSRSNHKVGQILCQMATPDPVKAYFKLEGLQLGTMTMEKALSAGASGDKSDYCFRLYRAKNSAAGISSKTWFGRSDEDGHIYQTDSEFSDPGNNRTYTFSDLTDGTYALRELLSVRENNAYRTQSIRITTSGGATAPVDLLFEGDDLNWDTNGDCTISNVAITGLTGGGHLIITITNEPTPCELTIHKESSDGVVEGISFKIEVYEPDYNVGWWDYRTVTTDAQGNFSTSVFPVGTKFRITELVPEGYVCMSENPQIIEYLDDQHNSVTFTNAPLVNGSLTIVKVDRGTRDTLEGAGFRLYDAEGVVVNEGYTNAAGRIEFQDLPIGEYEYQEFEAPVGYVLDDTRYPFSVTAENPEIEIERENDIIEGSIRVRKLNEQGQPMANVAFLLEYSLNDGMSWLPIGYRDYDDPVLIGCSTNDEAIDGVAVSGTDGWVEFDGLAISNRLCRIKYRLTEVKTWDGYELLSEPVFEGYLNTEQVSVELTAVNYPVYTTPMTGGDGFLGWVFALGLCILGAGTLLLVLPKKREAAE